MFQIHPREIFGNVSRVAELSLAYLQKIIKWGFIYNYLLFIIMKQIRLLKGKQMGFLYGLVDITELLNKETPEAREELYIYKRKYTDTCSHMIMYNQ